MKLISLMGGPAQYVKRLDHYFERGYHDMGDEPGSVEEGAVISPTC
jgi:hypothetical protein